MNFEQINTIDWLELALVECCKYNACKEKLNLYWWRVIKNNYKLQSNTKSKQYRLNNTEHCCDSDTYILIYWYWIDTTNWQRRRAAILISNLPDGKVYFFNLFRWFDLSSLLQSFAYCVIVKGFWLQKLDCLFTIHYIDC